MALLCTFDFFQSDVQAKCSAILNLGLLLGSMDPEEAKEDEQPIWLTYPHKLLQDFMGGYFVAKRNKVKLYFNLQISS